MVNTKLSKEPAGWSAVACVALLCGLVAGALGCGDEEEAAPAAAEEVAEPAVVDPPEEVEVPPPASLGTEAGILHNVWGTGAQGLDIEAWRDGRWMVFFSRILTRDNGSERTLFYAFDRNSAGGEAFAGRPFHETAYPVGEMSAQGGAERGIRLGWLAGTRERNGALTAWVRRRDFDSNLAPASSGRRVFRMNSPITAAEFRAGGFVAAVRGAEREEMTLRVSDRGALIAERLPGPGEAAEPTQLAAAGESVCLDQASDGSGVVVWVETASRRIQARTFDAHLEFGESTIDVGAALPRATMGEAKVGRPRVGAGPDGGFAVAWGGLPDEPWRDSYRTVLRLRQFGPDGAAVSDAQTVTPQFPLTLDAKYLSTNSGSRLDYRAFDVAVGPGGATGLAFVSSAVGARSGVRYLALYSSRFAADGSAQDDARAVEPIRETDIFVRVAVQSDADSNFAVAWIVGAKVRLRVYSAAPEDESETIE
jgi:hypothetical protein